MERRNIIHYHISMAGSFNIAFEISPLLTKTGEYGEKSGLYRLLYNSIFQLSEYIEKENLPHTIFLFTIYPHLLDEQSDEFRTLLDRLNIKLIFISPYVVGRPLVYVKEPLRFFSRTILKTYSQEDYMKRLFYALKENNVSIIHHSETCFFDVPGFFNVITMNDLVPVKFPEWCQEKTITNMKKKLSFAAKKCQGIICISQNTKKDLLNYLHTQNRKRIIEVIYPPVINPYRNDIMLNTSFINAQSQVALNGFSTIQPKKYFVAYGTYEPRKNLTMLVNTFFQLSRSNKLNDYKLVLIGGKGWGGVYTHIERMINEKYPILPESPIIQLGYVEDNLLFTFIKNAKAIIYPTLYEGFGYPIVESQLFKIPIIVSPNSSVSEVCKDNCRYFRNNNNGLEQVIMECIEDETIETEKHVSPLSADYGKTIFHYYSGLIQSSK